MEVLSAGCRVRQMDPDTDALDRRPVPPPADHFSEDERAVLERYFTNVDDHVFALRNLPEVVKGALFARYSRSPKSIRRLFVDEFVEHLEGLEASVGDDVGTERAADLYQRVFSEYGDDSVAQLGGAHVAVEEVSNLMTKQLEWGRLAAYLEQSTRYIPYDMQVDGRWRYFRDPDVMAGPHAAEYVRTLDAIFATYSASIPTVLDWVRTTWPQDEQTSDFVYRSATKAKALDLLRGLLPAATTSNVGMFASGQSMEQLLLRLRSSDLAEAKHLGDRLLTELREVIPAFLTRVDVPNRGGAWSDYLAGTRRDTRAMASELLGDQSAPQTRIHGDAGDAVTLVDWSPGDPAEAERLLVVGALYPHVDLSEDQLARHVDKLSADERAAVLRAYVGERTNRRHKPGRAFERVWYRFDVLGDYGGFRDLQRHRMLTLEWQPLSTRHGYDQPEELEDAGVADGYVEALERSASLYEQLLPDHPEQAQYAVCFAYRMRYSMQVNARAAMQMLELRSTPQGHPAYRRIVQDMHLAIRDVAGHTAVADAMSFVDHGAAELERLDSERAAEVRRQQRAEGGA
jgi:thymidylate synthase ThyX